MTFYHIWRLTGLITMYTVVVITHCTTKLEATHWATAAVIRYYHQKLATAHLKDVNITTALAQLTCKDERNSKLRIAAAALRLLYEHHHLLGRNRVELWGNWERHSFLSKKPSFWNAAALTRCELGNFSLNFQGILECKVPSKYQGNTSKVPYNIRYDRGCKVY